MLGLISVYAQKLTKIIARSCPKLTQHFLEPTVPAPTMPPQWEKPCRIHTAFKTVRPRNSNFHCAFVGRGLIEFLLKKSLHIKCKWTYLCAVAEQLKGKERHQCTRREFRGLRRSRAEFPLNNRMREGKIRLSNACWSKIYCIYKC